MWAATAPGPSPLDRGEYPPLSNQPMARESTRREAPKKAERAARGKWVPLDLTPSWLPGLEAALASGEAKAIIEVVCEAYPALELPAFDRCDLETDHDRVMEQVGGERGADFIRNYREASRQFATKRQAEAKQRALACLQGFADAIPFHDNPKWAEGGGFFLLDSAQRLVIEEVMSRFRNSILDAALPSLGSNRYGGLSALDAELDLEAVRLFLSTLSGGPIGDLHPDFFEGPCRRGVPESMIRQIGHTMCLSRGEPKKVRALVAGSVFKAFPEHIAQLQSNLRAAIPRCEAPDGFLWIGSRGAVSNPDDEHIFTFSSSNIGLVVGRRGNNIRCVFDQKRVQVLLIGGLWRAAAIAIHADDEPTPGACRTLIAMVRAILDNVTGTW